MSASGDNIALRKSLLEAIFFVRCQRQRPTVERIHHVVHRQQRFRNITQKKIEAELEAAVRRKELIATDKDGFKGYKEAFPVSRVKNGDGVKAAGELSDFTRTVMLAIQKLMEVRRLATYDSICNKLVHEFAMKGSRSDLRRRVEESCEQAIALAQVRRYCSGYVVTHYGRTFIKKSCSFKKTSQKKLLLDEILKTKEVATPIPICSLCLGTSKVNREGVPESMLACVDCGRCGHPSCLKFTSKLTETVKATKWQCIECKMCSICAKAGREQNMLFCDSCDRGFHMDCCHPPIVRRPKGNWECCLCSTTAGVNALSYRGPKRASCDDLPGECSDDGDGISGDVFDPDGLPPGVSEEDEVLFNRALERLNVEQNGLSVTQVARCPPRIEIGKFNVVTWYSSPYPQKYARLSTLYICEHCLTYVDSRSVLDSHMKKCNLRRPPGNEIYRQNNLSVFEVDGNVARTYCQNLCLLAKLFLDHKTLYYDVEPFVFYVLTDNDDRGSHLIGYFSKEKYCQQKYNLSCIMTLPQYQRQGYGRLLIDFSYMLSRVEGIPGSPEKPLSDLGQISYESYWRDVMMKHLNKLCNQTTSIQGLCELTGIAIPDILQTLQSLGFLFQSDNKSFSIVVDKLILDKWKARFEAKGRTNIELDESLLQWCPAALTSLVEYEEKQAEIELEQLSMVTNSIMNDRRVTLEGNKRSYSRRGKNKMESLSPVCSPTASPVNSRSDAQFRKYKAENNFQSNGLHSDCPPLNSSTPLLNRHAPQKQRHFKRRRQNVSCRTARAITKQGVKRAFGGQRLLKQKNLVNNKNITQTKTQRFLAAMESHRKSTRSTRLPRRHSSAAIDRTVLSPRSNVRPARLTATSKLSSSVVVSQSKVEKKLLRRHPHMQSQLKRTVSESHSSSEAVENEQQFPTNVKRKRGWVKGRPRNPYKRLLLSQLANAETPMHLVLNELALNNGNAEVPVKRKQGLVEVCPLLAGNPPAVVQTASNVCNTADEVAAKKQKVSLMHSRRNGSISESRLQKTPARLMSSLKKMKTASSQPASVLEIMGGKGEIITRETLRRKSHESVKSRRRLSAKETNSVSSSDVMESENSELQSGKRRRRRFSLVESVLKPKTVSVNDESSDFNKVLQAPLKKTRGWPKGRPRGKKKTVEALSEPIKASGVEQVDEVSNCVLESSRHSTLTQCIKEGKNRCARDSLPIGLSESENTTNGVLKNLSALKGVDSRTFELVDASPQVKNFEGYANVDYGKFDGTQSEAGVSDCTINYLTESEESNSTIDEVCSPLQNTINYWNQSVSEAHAKLANDVQTLNENELQSSAELAVSKTLTSVYGSQLSNGVECQMICENSMCVKPASSPLDNAVDMHRVLQQVGNPPVELTPLGMTFVR